FFSSRRRHTRFSRDWSSDVCSSDLARSGIEVHPHRPRLGEKADDLLFDPLRASAKGTEVHPTALGTSCRKPTRRIAIVAPQRRRQVQREADLARIAPGHITALPAQHKGCQAPAVHKEERLFAPEEIGLHLFPE